MLSKLNQEIIEKLNAGMSPAQISIEYESNNVEVSASYVRQIKRLLNAEMLHLIEDSTPAGFIKNSRDYEAYVIAKNETN